MHLFDTSLIELTMTLQPVFEKASNPWLLLYVPLAGGLPAVSSLGPLIGAGLAALAASWFFLRGMIGQAWRKIRGKADEPGPEPDDQTEDEQSTPEEEAIRKRLEGLGYLE